MHDVTTSTKPESATEIAANDSSTCRLHCQCAYAKIVPPETKAAVLQRLRESGAEFETVPDLCEMSARRDPRLKTIAQTDNLKISACYPRAVKWLFAAAGAELSDDSTEILNMRVQSADEICDTMLEDVAESESCENRPPFSAPAEEAPPLQDGQWLPWFPVIDYDRCTNCMQCLSFCLFGVYGVSEKNEIQVQNQDQCKTNCPACSRVCPETAIMFPKHKNGPATGEEVGQNGNEAGQKVDISALLGGDIYRTLRDRSEQARDRFSKERDAQTALQERRKCLKELQESLDIPKEALMSLPSMDQIQTRAQQARDQASESLARRLADRDGKAE